VLAAAVAIVGAACGGSGGGGSLTVPSSVSRPTQSAPPAPSADASTPSITRPPATEAREPATTSQAATPAPPRTGGPAASVPPTSTASGEEDGTTWWPWVLAGVAVAAVIALLLIFARSRRRSRWPAKAGVALDESDQITTELLTIAPGSLASVAGAEAARLAAVSASVDQLMRSAPDQTSKLAFSRLQEPMRTLHARLDAVALAPMPPLAVEENAIRAQAAQLHSETSLAWATIFPSRVPPDRRPGA